MSPKENNKKRANNKGKVPVTFSKTVTRRPAETDGFAAPQGFVGRDENHSRTPHHRAAKGDHRGSRKGIHDRAMQLHDELAAHQAKLGFTPDDPPRAAPPPPARKTNEPSSDWPSPEEVSATFNELRRSMGFPIKP